MAKKKEIKAEPKDCSKCNKSVVIEDLLYCKMRIQSINNHTSIGIVSFVSDCGYFRLKRVTNDEMIELRKENQDLKGL